MTHTNAKWDIDSAYKNRRNRVKIETPTGVRFYLDPTAAHELGVEIQKQAEELNNNL